MPSSRTKEVEEQRQQIRGSISRPERPTIIIPETWGTNAQEGVRPKPWDLEVIRNERVGRRKVQFSEASYISSRQHRQSLGARTDGGSDINDGPGANPFLDPEDNIAPDDRSGVASSEPEFYNNVTIVTPGGTFVVSRSPPPERKTPKGRRRETAPRYQGPHPFVPGKARHKLPGEVNRRHYTQYIYSNSHTDYAMTHHYLCETSDLLKPVYYYHDVGGYTRLDPNHSFTLHHGNHSDTPILGAMWHSSSGMHFAVGNPYMNLMDKDNANVTSIQRQHCDYLKPISSTPSRWHMDFTFGGGDGEGPKKHYRWQVVHLAEAIPHLRHGKLELRERIDSLVDEKGKKREKGKLLAAYRNVDDLCTNIWVRDPTEELGNELASLKWKTWVLLTWGGMRDRMQGPHNTGNPHHNVGYTKSTRVVELPGGKFPMAVGWMSPTPRTEEIRERRLNPEEY
ncbi:hypothetical protein DL95DRAFT_499241 [Leptodontidium sp. 2 PMI_412]|nr:hypothetical protein DL95DRAFT_499241 [Leptodontidium sp. 2 PMI_412]